MNESNNQWKRIVVKVGSSTITHETGKLNLVQMEKLVRQLAELHNQGKQVILVSSGAVGAGLGKLGLKQRPKTIPKKQAAAAVGQGILVHMYEKMFAEYGQVVAQMLLTREDLADRKRFLNAKNALKNLLDYGVIPIINENDTVSVDEIKFGDNDTLSALVASMAEANLLIILSDIDGLYTSNPKTDCDAQLLKVIEEITPEIESLASGAGTNLGTGGMITKLSAGKIATSSGVAMVIANGSVPNIIIDVMDGNATCSLFKPTRCLQGKKRWIAFGNRVSGAVVVDSGAADAIVEHGKSLLASGIIGVKQNFVSGDVVSVLTNDDKEIARGIVNFNATQVDLVKGSKSSDVKRILNIADCEEIIHRDNLVLC